MKITVKELTTVGPTIHSTFVDLPFIKHVGGSGSVPKPVLAYQSPSCIKIVGNIHAFLKAQEQGLPTVPVYLIQESESTLELLQTIIEYYDPLTLMDKALITRSAIELGVPRPTLAENIFPFMDLPPREKLIDQVLFLLDMPSDLQHFIVDKDLSLKRALIFQKAEGNLNWVSRFISNLKVGINMTAEIIQNIWEMAKQDDVDFKTKAQEMGLWEMADTHYEDNRQVLLDIRKRISEARFPILTKAGEDVQALLKAADLPSSVKVSWDPQFERQGLDISFHSKDEAELDQTLSKLSSPSFKELFKKV
ncbi:MAG: hypothetical protein K9M49_01570 [Candidatus Marinimicrobia bacterium]|nr:hypothetical protein [Candidatus Neomarinimicrobiota bacterium]MCF7850286.1 hypothetical protein [Candidatus Neomarinimicrobiota bacterium]MCF7903817.1 hypothetical protein [Candidatus Neomarinimicrobiota bacterium]